MLKHLKRGSIVALLRVVDMRGLVLGVCCSVETGSGALLRWRGRGRFGGLALSARA